MMQAITLLLLTATIVSAADEREGRSAFVKDSEVYVLEPGSAEARQLTSDGIAKSEPLLSPDGHRIVFQLLGRSGAMAHLVVIRVYDAAGNAGLAKVVVR